MSHSVAAHVDVISVRLAFGERRVFDGLSCRFPEGKLSVILGSSGGGKSTLLRVIAGLQKPDYGDVWVGDEEVTCMSEHQLGRLRRKIGMMFQDGALLDSLSIYENTALPLREHSDLSESDIAERVNGCFEAVGLKKVGELLPAQLSGGMRKRAALARAMVMQPQILLCDEPFSGLDPLAVRMIESLLVDLSRSTGITMILTNHHIAATMRMADEVVFLCDGAAICGPVKEIQESIDPRVRAFMRAASPGPLEPGEVPSPGERV